MKAQASVEFMVLISLLAVLFIVYVQGDYSMQRDSQAIQARVEAQKFSDSIAFEINSAVDSGGGYSRRFFIEDSFSGITNFTITVKDYSVVIIWSSNSVSSLITANNITGSVKTGWNLIENKDGGIYVS